MEKPILLLYCQHSLGIGHLVRSFRIAEALVSSFRIVFINGGPLPDTVAVPAGIEIEQLPPIGMRPEGGLISRDASLDLEDAMAARREQLLRLLTACEPTVLLIELFPFGRRKFKGELIPLLEAANAMARRPLILTSLRDLLVQHPTKQRQHECFATDIINAYVDAVLVHADPTFARLDETFTPARPLNAEIHYTGFVAPKFVAARPVSQPGTILVSAGSGTVGAPLFNAALDAQPTLFERTGRAMTLIAGPFLDDATWQVLQRKAAGRDGLTLLRSVPDMVAELRHAAVSISQCGYNTIMDILTAPLPALVVPFVTPKENEQIERAHRLQKRGIISVIHPDTLNAERLINETIDLLAADMFHPRIDMKGAGTTAQLVRALLAEKREAGGPGRAR